jgi:hypothetical protein
MDVIKKTLVKDKNITQSSDLLLPNVIYRKLDSTRI